jgi:4-hydroxybenzoate polyprenyltransferase
MSAWLRAFRLHHWSKNLVVFAPLVLGHVYTDRSKVLLAVAGFVLVSILTSAGYVINDLVDIGVDRHHQTKRHRPFASGKLAVTTGIICAVAMIAAACFAAAFLPRAFLLLLLSYLVLMLAYSFGLREIAFVDVAAIATLFCVRIALGAAVIEIGQSVWLLSFGWALFLSLSLAKRHCELMRTEQQGGGVIQGRGFHSTDWPLTLTFGVGAGIASIVIMLLYLANDAAPSGFYPHHTWLYAVPGIVLIWLMRVWLMSHRTKLDDDPVIFALRDPASIAMAAIVAATFMLAS